jgi:peptidoglycan/LPS O-acetylase OafA/YrhL
MATEVAATTSESSRPSNIRTGRRGDVQGLRAVAVILVVLFHAGLPVPGGFVGVDVFFVISGYVVTRMLYTELIDHDRIDLRAFYLRRIRRILPALGVLLVFTLVAGIVLAPVGGQKITANTGAAASVFSANLYLMTNAAGYFDISSSANALLHTWSLSVEEQFYLVFPGVLLGAWVLARRRAPLNRERALVAALGVIFVVSFVASGLLTNGFGPVHSSVTSQRYAFYSAPTRAWEFALGGLVALAAGWFVRLPRSASLSFALLGVVGIAWAAFALSEQSAFPGRAAIPPVVGTALLIAAGERAGMNPLNRALAIRPAQEIGGASYSWYLWHWPIIVFAGALWPDNGAVLVVAAVVSYAPAALSLHFVENPIRFRRHPPPRRTLVLGGLCIVVPLVAAGALIGANRVIVRTAKVHAFDVALRLHADVARGCDNPTPLGERRHSHCEWRVDAPVGRAVLIGDSNAGQFTEAFTSGFTSKRWDATVATLSSCPFADVTLVEAGRDVGACRRFVDQSTHALMQDPPDVVIIASASDLYLRGSEFEFVRKDGRVARTLDEKRSAWQEGTRALTRTLEAKGIQVVLVNPAPKFGTWDPRECATIRRTIAPESCGVSRSTAEMRRWRAPALAAERHAVAGSSARTIDVFKKLCPAARCATQQHGRWEWRDGSHITVRASQQLASAFSAAAERPRLSRRRISYPGESSPS